LKYPTKLVGIAFISKLTLTLTGLQVDHHYAPNAHFDLGFLLAKDGQTDLAKSHYMTAQDYASKVKSYTLEHNVNTKVSIHMDLLPKEEEGGLFSFMG